MKLSDQVVGSLVNVYGWDAAEARQVVDSARVCVDGVAWEDLPGVLADLLNAQREGAKDAQE